ncbi:MAG: OstA-like protein [Bacteroidia bacterium]|nr:OstA-like protein [Bacteroidia bacterium]
MNRIKSIFLLIITLHFSFVALAQQKESADSLVRLVSAVEGQLLEIDSVQYRKIIGPARFLHNDTYLLCDTALWNVNTNVIYAIGNVQVIQENTFLQSHQIEYIVSENLAKVSGNLVQLFDKEGNILKTNHLDYNTKDSVAVFYNGGSMRNNDGSIMESINGTYDSKQKLFTFAGDVNMFTDSVFIKSDKIEYKTDLAKAYFGRNTTGWQNDNMLFANSGEFDRGENLFIFDKDGYIFTPEQELWADRINYYRLSGRAFLYDNIQILDTVQKSICMADAAVYNPSPMRINLSAEPVVGMYSYENGKHDTLYLRADKIDYYIKRYKDIDSAQIQLSKQRVELSNLDPIKINDDMVKAARDRAIARSEARDAMFRPKTKEELEEQEQMQQQEEKKEKEKGVLKGEGLQLQGDLAQEDSLEVKVDSVALALEQQRLMEEKQRRDTMQIVFLDAFHNVKFHRSDIQGVCDSLVYTGLDSMARFYKDPVMWSDTIHQFSADSMQAVIKDQALSKVNMITNAFIASRQDSVYFNQIKATEMVAFFSNNEVYRFDALGGASALLFMEEDSIVTIMNHKECKMLTARLRDRTIKRTRYINELKQDAHPVFLVNEADRTLRGFQWNAQRRPKSRNEITDRGVRKSWRATLQASEFPDYYYTGKFFPEKRDSIVLYKSYVDSVILAKKLQKQREAERKKYMDSLANKSLEGDSLSVPKPLRDSSGLVVDSLAVAPDSAALASGLEVAKSKELSAKELRKQRRELKKQKKELRRKEKMRRREQKKLERQRRKEQKLLKKKAKEDVKN